jgi:hypothetical protein
MRAAEPEKKGTTLNYYTIEIVQNPVLKIQYWRYLS